MNLSSVKALPFQDHLEICNADLSDANSIDKAIEGCDYVMHVADPVIMERDEKEIVELAVKGATAVMNSAIKHKIKAVIMTSGITTVINYEAKDKVLNKEDWPDISKLQPYYIKAKSLSERIAWEIYNVAEVRPRLVVIIPAYILGPTILKMPFFSGNAIMSALNGTLKDTLKLYYGRSDVGMYL